MSRCNQMCVSSNRLLLQAALALALLVVLSLPTPAIAQHRGGTAGGGGFPGGMRSGDVGGFPRSANVPSEMNRSNPGRKHPNLPVGPPGRWWDDKHFAKQLKHTEGQQRHMDAIFEQNRPTLLKRYENLGLEEQRMEALTHAKTLDESALFAQIDRIEQARAELGK